MNKIKFNLGLIVVPLFIIMLFYSLFAFSSSGSSGIYYVLATGVGLFGTVASIIYFGMGEEKKIKVE